jgi:hypothetical protein
MERLLIWATGYNRSLLARYNASASDKRTLCIIGASLLFAGLWFGSMATLAAWTMAFQLPTEGRLLVSAGVGALAIGFVLVFDRAFIFAADTSSAGRGKTIAFGSLRILIVVAVGSLVDVAFMPVVMGPELEQESVLMSNAADAERFTTLNRRYDVGARQTERDGAERAVDEAEVAAANLPPAIAALLTQATRCFTELPQRGVERTILRRRCAALQRNAQRQRTDYQRAAGQRLAEARADHENAEAGFRRARDAVDTQFAAATQENARIYVAGNFQVFVNLVTTHPAAAMKAAVLTIIHIVFDLLPFLVKGYFGRTGVGGRISAEKEGERLDAEAYIDEARANYLVRLDSSRAAANAAQAALQRPSMLRFMQDMAEAETRTVEPVRQAVATLQRVTAVEDDMANILARTPAMRRLKLELWSAAVSKSLRATVGQSKPAYRQSDQVFE